MKTQDKHETNKEKNQTERLENKKPLNEADAVIKDKATPIEFPIPIDLMDDMNKDKIDPLTEGISNLGYEEKPPRKKELDQKEHLDRDDK